MAHGCHVPYMAHGCHDMAWISDPGLDYFRGRPHKFCITKTHDYKLTVFSQLKYDSFNGDRLDESY